MAEVHPHTSNFSVGNGTVTSTVPLKAIGNYIMRESIGKGSMGKVKLAVHKVTGEKIAVKIIPRADAHKCMSAKQCAHEQSREMRTIREGHIMLLLNHPHIVRLKELTTIGPYFYILMDYVGGGQLLHYIVKRNRLSEKHARHFVRQIVSALDYMHRNSVVHRDLKIENIMVDQSGRNIKIIDFGLSNLFCPERLLKTYCGSLYFAAPELLRSTPYRGPEIDVWSLGVVIYVMVTGSMPFDDRSMPGLHEKIKSGQVAYPAHLSPECRDLLSRAFKTDPEARIILADIIRHPWLNKGYAAPVENYLPTRKPLQLPLDPRVVHSMTYGFNMGTTRDIRLKLELIVNSPIYQTAADHVATCQAHQDASSCITNPMTASPYPHGYDDPQTVPAAYHPLLSLYYLTQERLVQAEKNKRASQTTRTTSCLSTIPSGSVSTTSDHASNPSSVDRSRSHPSFYATSAAAPSPGMIPSTTPMSIASLPSKHCKHRLSLPTSSRSDTSRYPHVFQLPPSPPSSGEEMSESQCTKRSMSAPMSTSGGPSRDCFHRFQRWLSRFKKTSRGA
ncbi:kinase-like domain-containing protein [Radiomyces spectabilis]|uniref:kinase-like domain-containing protein n=1 Tax=Radiomyces spectabilis TaxID=64574 RepID=UPI00221E4EEE|nr:kinase-like domain-containing protein [Radiomyces spectabilis]KAI8381446.1 kinase-like domain-containing protein [Radiomyces spectabilis]